MAAARENCRLPFEIRKLSDESKSRIASVFTQRLNFFREVGPSKWFLHELYEETADKFYNFKIYPQDTIVAGFPRSGSTIVQELVWLLTNQLDYKTAKETPVFDRICSFNNFTSTFGSQFEPSINGRVLKTHHSFELLPPDLLTCGAKVLYVARNPKDVIVSFYHMNLTFKPFGFEGTFEDFYECFEKDLVVYAPFWKNIEEGWAHRDNANFCFLFYEEFVKDRRKFIQKVANFLNTPVTDEEIDALEKHLSFKNFQNNDSVNAIDYFKARNLLVQGCDEKRCFIRNGKIGGWRAYFNEDLNKRADCWIAENVRKIGIKFIDS